MFRDRLDEATLYRLSAGRRRAEFLEMLFPDGMGAPPRLSDPSAQAYTLSALAAAYHLNGRPGQAIPLYERSNESDEKSGRRHELAVGLDNLSEALRHTGGLRESEGHARRALVIARDLGNQFQQAISLQLMGLIMAARGVLGGSQAALRRSLRVFHDQDNAQGEGLLNFFLAQAALWPGDPAAARPLANLAWEWAHVHRVEIDFIRAARVRGEAALGLNDLEVADERLSHALARARAVDRADEELPTLVALAEVRRRQANPSGARQLLEDVWEPAELGPYPLLHADARDVLARIERDEGNKPAAVEAATAAYRLAWCDGPPFAYHWGLEAAKAHLAALGAPEPDDLPPYDESQYEPMPEVEIDPPEGPT